MAGTEDPLFSNNEKEFLLRCLNERSRSDGRFLLEYRRISYSFGRSEGKSSAEVTLGNTRVFAVVTATVAPPFPDRPNEGFLAFQVNTSPMSGTTYDVQRQTTLTSQLARMLERQIRDSRALDIEALCITPGSKVWALRCDVQILDDCGNLVDACALATIAAILHFRRADVSIREGKAVIHSYEERAPVPLAVHHIPVCVTYGLFRNIPDISASSTKERKDEDIDTDIIGERLDDVIAVGDEIVAVDPTDRESIVADGMLSFVMNAHKELCGIHKLGGCPVPPKALLLCAKVAGVRAVAMIAQLKAALADAEAAELEKQRVRHGAATLGAAEAIDVQVGTTREDINIDASFGKQKQQSIASALAGQAPRVSKETAIEASVEELDFASRGE